MNATHLANNSMPHRGRRDDWVRPVPLDHALTKALSEMTTLGLRSNSQLGGTSRSAVLLAIGLGRYDVEDLRGIAVEAEVETVACDIASVPFVYGIGQFIAE
jgi:hypothetical protein